MRSGSLYSNDEEDREEDDEDDDDEEDEEDDEQDKNKDKDADNISPIFYLEANMGGAEPDPRGVPDLRQDQAPPPDYAMDTMLHFLYFMCTEDFPNRRSSSSLLIYFAAVRGISPSVGAEFR